MTGVKKSAPRRAPPLPAPQRFGAHLSVAGGLHHALRAARALRCGALQVFVKNQRQWRIAQLDPLDLARWRELRAQAQALQVVAHATYLINLATCDAQLRDLSRNAFAQELLRCDVLAIPHLVIHPGSATTSDTDAALTHVARSLDAVFAAHPALRATPLLEITAGQGRTLGRSFRELGEIIRRVRQPERIGICLDTCHLFAAGYDLRSPAGYAAMCAEAAREVGLERIRCWHLNDSRGALGSRLDRHEHIGAGQLGTAAFRNVIADLRFVGLPMIIETAKGTDARGRDLDRVNLQRLRQIAARVRPAATGR